MKKFLTSVFGLLLFSFYAHSQGCVAVRNLTGFGQFSVPEANSDPIRWLGAANVRYSQFNDTYIESSNQNLPPEDRTFSETVIVDFTLARNLADGWSLAIDLPLTYANRENWQDHGRAADKAKFKTSSFGLADIRLSVYKWLLDVNTPHKGNIQLGLGLKLPSGDYRYQDYFHRPEGTVLAPVNFTLQPGDGGTGITTELNSFYTLTKSINLYANGFYLFNPRDQNGTNNKGGAVASAAEIEATADVNSVADAFSVRGGANFTTRNFVFWAGVRFEGSPAHDAIGQSNGLRRAGYTVSAEPGINYKVKKAIIFAFVPITLYGTIKQSVPEQRLGVPSRGGVVGYQINFGVLLRK